MAASSLSAASATSADHEKQASLRRVKLLATAMLALCVAVFALAKWFEPSLPWLSFVAAFAEAAVIGGLADWYAVVALFRRPLGLPIPHTAIIPRNQERIADNLGRFIEVNFLAPGPVREKLKEVDFAALVSDWMSDPHRAAGLSAFATRLAPQVLAAVEDSGLKRFVTDRMMERLEKVKVAPLAADLLDAFTQDRRHQVMIDEIARVLGRFLDDEKTLELLRDRIREEMPTVFRLFRADAYLLKRIVRSAATLLDEMRADPDHPVRTEFDSFVKRFIARLKTSRDYSLWAEKMKSDLLARPEIRKLMDDAWSGIAAFIEQDLEGDQSRIRSHLTDLFADIGRHLARDPQVRADMNEGFVTALSTFVEHQKGGVSTFIADQVRRWDLTQLTRLIELNIGRDLQYIRFNGMVIGGLAGLVLHIGERLVIGG